MNDDSSHQVNLLDFVAFLLRWRRFLITAVLGVSAVVAVISFILPSKFRSTAVIRAYSSAGPGIGGLIASKLGALGSLASFAPSFGEVPEQTFITILKSRWMCETIIDSLHLRNVYKMPTAPIEQVITAFKGNTDFQLDDKTFHVIIYGEDKDPYRAKSIVDLFIGLLDERNQDLKAFGAGKEKDFVGKRLSDERTRLVMLEDSMSHFQMRTGILNVEEQVKATIQASAALEAQRLATLTELQMNESIMGRASSESAFLRMKLSSIDSTLLSLVKPREAGDGDNLLLHLQDASIAGVQYLRLMRDIEIQQMLVAYLLQQYEQAKIDELRNTPTLMRLDPPVVATMRIWPRRGLMVVVSAMATLVFATTLALILEGWQKAASDPSHPNHERVRAIGEAFRRKRIQAQ